MKVTKQQRVGYYRKLRLKGYPARYAWSAAVTYANWHRLQRQGLVKSETAVKLGQWRLSPADAWQLGSVGSLEDSFSELFIVCDTLEAFYAALEANYLHEQGQAEGFQPQNDAGT